MKLLGRVSIQSSLYLKSNLIVCFFTTSKGIKIGQLGKGPYIKDVHTEGGRGVGPKADIVREVAWI